MRILRGGSWFFDPLYCRSAYRASKPPASLDGDVGFRVCCLPQGRSILHRIFSMTDFSNLISMVSIPAGKFLMGSPPDEKGRYADEGPQHEVTLESFLMGRTPVTQAQWREVAGLPQVERSLNPDPSYFKGDNKPVDRVSWFDAVEFCRRLSRATGRHYCLPSEAQWEYACRAGTTTPFAFGDTLSANQANFNSHSTSEVGSFPANRWGLYDMHGNVWEWCKDQWHDSYNGAPTDGSAWDDCLGKTPGAASCAAAPASTSPTSAALPSGSATARPSSVTELVSASAADCLGKTSGASCAAAPGSSIPASAARPAGTATTRPTSTATLGSASAAHPDMRLLRGGSWINVPLNCRSAYRYRNPPVSHDQGRGFRVCCLPRT